MDLPAGHDSTSVLLVVTTVAQAGGDAIGCGDEVRTEGVDELLEGDHGGVGGKAEGSHDIAGVVAYGGGDCVETGGPLFVVDREVVVQNRVELLVQRFLAGDCVGPGFCSSLVVDPASCEYRLAGRG